MTKSQVLSFVGGLLSGALVGAATVVLLAPQSGLETREGIATKVNEIIAAGRQAAADRRRELEMEYRTRIQIPLPPVKVEAE